MQLHGASHLALVVKNPPANSGDIRDARLIPELARSPGGGHGNSLQYSCLENPHKQSSLVGYNLQGLKELDTTEVAEHICTHMPLHRFCLTHPSC